MPRTPHEDDPNVRVLDFEIEEAIPRHWNRDVTSACVPLRVEVVGEGDHPTVMGATYGSSGLYLDWRQVVKLLGGEEEAKRRIAAANAWSPGSVTVTVHRAPCADVHPDVRVVLMRGDAHDRIRAKLGAASHGVIDERPDDSAPGERDGAEDLPPAREAS